MLLFATGLTAKKKDFGLGLFNMCLWFMIVALPIEGIVLKCFLNAGTQVIFYELIIKCILILPVVIMYFNKQKIRE